VSNLGRYIFSSAHHRGDLWCYH